MYEHENIPEPTCDGWWWNTAPCGDRWPWYVERFGATWKYLDFQNESEGRNTYQPITELSGTWTGPIPEPDAPPLPSEDDRGKERFAKTLWEMVCESWKGYGVICCAWESLGPETRALYLSTANRFHDEGMAEVKELVEAAKRIDEWELGSDSVSREFLDDCVTLHKALLGLRDKSEANETGKQ